MISPCYFSLLETYYSSILDSIQSYKGGGLNDFKVIFYTLQIISIISSLERAVWEYLLSATF